MTQLKRQIIAVLATGSMVFAQAPMVLAADLTVSGNGANSENEIEIESSRDTTVVQSNSAIVTNNVSSTSKTGENEANDNTGGDVMIRTGDAMSISDVENTLNSNMSTVDCCGVGDLDVEISGNGADSENEVEFDNEHSDIQVFQDNLAVVDNNVDSAAKTGYNDANRNTGGDVTIRTGDAWAKSDVSTTANQNLAVVGGNGDGMGELSAVISGNGADSDNSVEFELDGDILLVQDNFAEVLNYVDAYAKTGGNDANDNTGGEVGILTGWAKATVDVDNLVNFNAADVDCGCLLDVDAKVSGNGADSDNEIEVDLGGDLDVFQGGHENEGNFALLSNYLDAYAKTGWNEADANTGDPGADPFIWTGNAYSHSDVENVGNSNVFGDLELEMPEVHFNFSVAMAMHHLSSLWSM